MCVSAALSVPSLLSFPIPPVTSTSIAHPLHLCLYFCPTDTFISITLLDCTAAAAKSLKSCPTLCYPIDGSLPGSPIPGILQARILEWVAISFSNA